MPEIEGENDKGKRTLPEPLFRIRRLLVERGKGKTLLERERERVGLALTKLK